MLGQRGCWIVGGGGDAGGVMGGLRLWPWLVAISQWPPINLEKKMFEPTHFFELSRFEKEPNLDGSDQVDLSRSYS